MSKSESLAFGWKLISAHNVPPLLCLLAVCMGLHASAAAQQFTMTMNDFQPSLFAVNPGSEATANIQINPVAGSGFTGTVSLGCAVATTTNLPACYVSPPTVTPSSSATLVVTTEDSANGTIATPGSYTVTVTATGGSTTLQQSKDLSVLSVTEAFTITVATTPSPGSVPAGSGAQATISVNPINGYNGVVTLACSSISPLVEYPPVCSFAYPSGQPGLPVNGVNTTTTLTITTLGPTPITKATSQGKFFFAYWLPLPMLALLGVGAVAGGKRSRKVLGLLALFVVMGSILLMPACGSNRTYNNPNNVVTPANTYTFTLKGIDQNGVVSSNAGSTNVAPSVSLTVTAPTTQ
jgi:hypothetical protein